MIGLPTATVPLWRLNFSLVGIPAIVQLFLVVTIVDSPRWLVSVNRVEEARSALHRLRGKNASIDAEFYEIVSAQLGPAAAASTVSDPEFASNPVEEEEALHDDSATATEKMKQRSEEIHGETQLHNREPLSLIGIFTDSLVRHITIIVLFLHFTQQWIGKSTSSWQRLEIILTKILLLRYECRDVLFNHHLFGSLQSRYVKVHGHRYDGCQFCCHLVFGHSH